MLLSRGGSLAAHITRDVNYRYFHALKQLNFHTLKYCSEKKTMLYCTCILLSEGVINQWNRELTDIPDYML